MKSIVIILLAAICCSNAMLLRRIIPGSGLTHPISSQPNPTILILERHGASSMANGLSSNYQVPVAMAAPIAISAAQPKNTMVSPAATTKVVPAQPQETHIQPNESGDQFWHKVSDDISDLSQRMCVICFKGDEAKIKNCINLEANDRVNLLGNSCYHQSTSETVVAPVPAPAPVNMLANNGQVGYMVV